MPPEFNDLINICFSGQTNDLMRIPLNSISKMDSESFGPPHPTLIINNPNIPLEYRQQTDLR